MITKVTITGADDKTMPEDILDISERFPFVEWGILVSKSSAGNYRFPSSDWISKFSGLARVAKLNVSMHLCGQWVRQLLAGELSVSDLPMVARVCQRMQINTHSEPHTSTVGMMERLYILKSAGVQEFIFQWDGVNDHLAYAAAGYGYNVSALFDTSAGAGILPNDWPDPPMIPFGYAGGLSPDNVVAEVHKMEQAVYRASQRSAHVRSEFWIDMERNVRTDDDSELDMAKVRQVLINCKPLVPVSLGGLRH